MSWDLELNSLFKNVNAPAFSWESGRGDDRCRREPIPIYRRNRSEEDEYVDIISCKNSDEPLILPDSFEDVAESSSSFSDTGGSENAVSASFGDPEVVSRMYVDKASSSVCDDSHEPLRQSKRETTDHWRRFISPVMSHCKWIELKLKQLQSQACKYEKELAELDHKKEIDYAHFKLDGSDIKSVPFSRWMHRSKVMKRKKRKRVEMNRDSASHRFSNHALFSYYEKANRNVDDGLEDCHEAAIGGDSENLVEFKLNDFWSLVGDYDNDKSWDAAIQKILAMESQLQNLKSRHDKVISENQERFCSVNQDGFDHPDIKPDSLAGTVSSGDDKIVPLTEATDRPQLPLPRDNINNEDLAWYQLAKEELQELENFGNQLVDQIESIKENAVPNVNAHSTLKSCSALKSNIPRNKRKRENISSKKRSRRSG